MMSWKLKIITLIKFKIMKINRITVEVMAVVLIALICLWLKKSKGEKEIDRFVNNDFKKSDEDKFDFDNASEWWFV